MKTYSAGLLVPAALVLLNPTVWGGLFPLPLSDSRVASYSVTHGTVKSYSVTIDGVQRNDGNTALITATHGGVSTKTVCMDLNNTLAGGYFAKIASSTLDDVDWLGLNPKWGNPKNAANAFTAANAAGYLFWKAPTTAGWSATDNNANYQALQLAVWESLYDTPNSPDGLSFGNGRFKLNSTFSKGAAAPAAPDLAKNLIADAQAQLKNGTMPDMDFDILIPVKKEWNPKSCKEHWVWDTRSAQELMFDAESIIVTPVPEASTWMAGLGAVSLMAGALWRRR